jgi:hypothetical protein
MKLRDTLRQIRGVDPTRYQQLLDQARDYSLSTGETTLQSGMMTPENLEKYMRGELKTPVYQPEHLWNED